MAGVHGLKHIERFLTATLTDDDAIGTHAKGVLDKFALAYLAFAFGVRRPGLHSPNMWKLELQFGGVFNGDNSFLGRNVARHRIQQSRFAAAGAARNDK